MDSKCRILIISSSDFGEISHSQYFIDDLNSLSCEVKWLVPENRRYLLSQDSRWQHACYCSADDLEQEINRFSPDLVLLFSGYLITTKDSWSFIRLYRLIRKHSRAGVRFVTSDPFIGMQDQFSQLDFRILISKDDSNSRSIRYTLKNAFLRARFMFLARVLSNLVHVYPVSASNMGNHSKTMDYFNPPASRDGYSLKQDDVVFVLSEMDMKIQYHKHGKLNFIRLLKDKLTELELLGYRVSLVAPSDLVDRLGTQSGLENIVLLHGLSLPRYQQVIGQAGIVFFWNYFSFSILMRVQQGSPVIFLDHGHMVDLLPRLAAAGTERFYLGWQPPYLEMHKPLSNAQLQSLLQQSKTAFENVLLSLQKLGNSDAVVKELCCMDPGK